MPVVLTNVTYDYNAPSGKQSKKKAAAAPQTHENAALKNVSLTINEGEFFGVIGHTGSGKSTMMQLIDGLILPTEGTVTVDGLDTLDKKVRREARSRVGLVFQYPEYQLFEETVEKDIAFGPKNLGLGEEEIAARVQEAMYFVGLQPEVFAKKSPFELSGGEKRRAALAGIIAMRPKYLVLDEPMAGLDPQGRLAILDMLQRLRTETGCAVIMVSHSMDDMARFADRVAVLSSGELLSIGPAAEILCKTEELEGMRLTVPQAAKLAGLLRARGIPVPEHVIKSEDLTAFLLSYREEVAKA